MRLIRILISAVASLLLTAPLPAVGTTATPFKADLSLHASFTGTSQPGGFTVTTSGKGQVPHLGTVTTSSSGPIHTPPGTWVSKPQI